MWGTIGYLGMSALSMFGSSSSQQTQADMMNKLKKAQNKQIMVSTYNSIGRINENKIQAVQQSQGIARAIQREEIGTMGSAQVAAGAAGVRGRSVDQAFASINREAATKELQREAEIQSAVNAYEAQMDNTWDAGFNQMDFSPNAESDFSVLGSLMDTAMGFSKGSSAFDSITGTVGQLFGKSGTKAAGADAGAGGGGILSSITSGLSGLLGKVTGGLGSIFSTVGGLLGF